ncbi:MAG: hypothetical protein IIA00_06295 [Proteobacteria bacterium]|nr:hypothetical protein [Pseudomonadota bacterium]
MELTFQIVDKIDPVAFYAAIVATAILIWDVVKWLRSGARVQLRVSSDMKTFNDPDPRRKGKTYIIGVVTNTGSSPTTITHLATAYYKNRWDQLRRKFSFRGIIIIAQAANHLPLPHVLKVGEEWSGMIEQDDEVVRMAKNGVLHAEVYHSVGKRPARARIVIRSEEGLKK